jgi:hypothetical protein
MCRIQRFGIISNVFLQWLSRIVDDSNDNNSNALNSVLSNLLSVNGETAYPKCAQLPYLFASLCATHYCVDKLTLPKVSEHLNAV